MKFETIEYVAKISAAMTAIAGAVLLLWRYLLGPFRKVVGTLNRRSAEISSALPVLFAIAESWPEPSRAGSLVSVINSLREQIEYNQARITSILEHHPGEVYECSPEGECLYANPAICELFGLSKQEMRGSGWLGGIEPAERERVYNIWTAAVQKKIPYECQYVVRNAKTGRRFEVRTIALPLYNSNHEIIGYQGFFSSVSPLKTMDAPKYRITSSEREDDGRFLVHLSCGHSWLVQNNRAGRDLLVKGVCECALCDPDLVTPLRKLP